MADPIPSGIPGVDAQDGTLKVTETAPATPIPTGIPGVDSNPTNRELVVTISAD